LEKQKRQTKREFISGQVDVSDLDIKVLKLQEVVA